MKTKRIKKLTDFIEWMFIFEGNIQKKLDIYLNQWPRDSHFHVFTFLPFLA